MIQVLDRLSSYENMSFARNEKVLFDIGLLCMHELGMNKLDEVQRVFEAFYSKAFYNAPAEKNRHVNAIGMFMRTLRAYMQGLPAKKAAQARARSEKNAARNTLAPSPTQRRKQHTRENMSEQWLLPVSPLKLMRQATLPLAPTAA